MSASAVPFRLWSHDVEGVLVSFRPSSTATPVDLRGNGYTVAWISTGLWRVTFNRPRTQSEFEGAINGLQMVSAVDLKLQFGPFVAATPTANSTLDVRALAVAAVTDIALDNNNRICFIALFRTTNLRV